MDTEQTERPGWVSTFRSLHQRDVRAFLFGQLIALSGAYLQIAALNWLIYRLTDSPLILGLVSFVALLPVGLLSLFSGAISDSLPSRKLILIVRLVGTVQGLVLTILALTGWIQVWHIMVLILIAAAVDTLELPTRYVFLSSIVGGEDYSNAVALNASANNIGRILGPALSGVLIAWIGEASCFLLSSVSSLVFVAILLSMRFETRSKPSRGLRLASDALDGFKYMWNGQGIRGLLVLVAIPFLFAQPYVVLMPVFARDVLNSEAMGYGLLMGVIGISAVLGGLITASLRDGSRGHWLVGAGITFLILLSLFSLSRSLPLSIGILLAAGVAQSVFQVLAMVLLQSLAARDFHGRVVSFFGLLNNGLLRLGGLQAGALSQYASAPFAIQFGAVLSLCWLLLIAWRMPFIRRLA